ncbi:endonuclease VII domain-containing protein [Paraburkholderia youngii]|uniref:endonuclease VII domain-containing protein n=1 Tax=Paraburkholderia youngii TaxID=2782701 RepID=UPI003D1A2F19
MRNRSNLYKTMLYSPPNKRWNEQTADPSKYPQGRFNPKPCRRCSTVFIPKAPSNLYCSQECSDHAWTTAYLKRTYDIDYDHYLSMLAEQSGVCALCGGEGFKMAGHHRLKLVVDHCHKTGRIRGLLCHNCNRALGLLHDDTDVIRKAIGYLEGETSIRKGSGPKRAKAQGPR